MFALCEGMKWTHLPNAGGLYDQHPDLLDGFKVIFFARAEHEAEQEAEREAKHRAQTGKAPSRSRPRSSGRAPRRR